MNIQQTVETLVSVQLKPESEIPSFSVGDTINVHVRIIEGEKERCLAAGMNSCVTKPFDLEELFQEIKKLTLSG